MQRIVFENRSDEPFRTFGDGCVGTIRTIDSGGDKRVLEVKVIGQMDNTIDHTFESANRVYDTGGCSPTINTCGGGGLQPKIIENYKMDGNNYNQRNVVHGEHGICRTIIGQGHCGNEPKVIVAMRGRNPENPSDRTVGCPTEQRLEPNSQGISNTITSVQKDNLVMETVKIKQATKDGYIECQVGGIADLSFPDSNTRRGRVQDNGQVSPTLMACESDICRIEKIGQISNDGNQYGTVISDQGLCSTLQAVTHGYANNCIQTQYRIRKLTPRECWRLMNFTDSDFEKAAEVNSNTQLYRQAGNSICKNVLVAIFGQMLEGREDAYRKL